MWKVISFRKSSYIYIHVFYELQVLYKKLGRLYCTDPFIYSYVPTDNNIEVVQPEYYSASLFYRIYYILGQAKKQVFEALAHTE